MGDWQPLATAPKNMRDDPKGTTPIELYAELDGYGDEWAIVEWDKERGWVTSATDDPLVYANEPHARVFWRPVRPLLPLPAPPLPTQEGGNG